MHIVCPHCTTSYAINPSTLGPAGRTVRCSRCKETGFLGRLAILEILPITDAMREQILVDSSAKLIKDLALREGMKTLTRAGLLKAKAGLTSLDEVLRVAG